MIPRRRPLSIGRIYHAVSQCPLDWTGDKGSCKNYGRRGALGSSSQARTRGRCQGVKRFRRMLTACDDKCFLESRPASFLRLFLLRERFPFVDVVSAIFFGGARRCAS